MAFRHSVVGVGKQFNRLSFVRPSHLSAFSRLRPVRLHSGFPTVVSNTQFHTTAVVRNENNQDSRPKLPGKVFDQIEILVDKIRGSTEAQLYHWSSMGMFYLWPFAIVLSPSMANLPVDLALNVFIPFHAHLGMTQVLVDYVPRKYQNWSIILLYIATGAAALGLLKVNLCGSGITESVKSLWRPTPKKSKEAKAPKADTKVEEGNKETKVEKADKSADKPKEPKEEKPKDKPKEDKPKEDKPKEDKPKENKPKSDAEKPATAKKEADTHTESAKPAKAAGAEKKTEKKKDDHH